MARGEAPGGEAPAARLSASAGRWQIPRSPVEWKFTALLLKFLLQSFIHSTDGVSRAAFNGLRN